MEKIKVMSTEDIIKAVAVAKKGSNHKVVYKQAEINVVGKDGKDYTITMAVRSTYKLKTHYTKISKAAKAAKLKEEAEVLEKTLAGYSAVEVGKFWGEEEAADAAFRAEVATNLMHTDDKALKKYFTSLLREYGKMTAVERVIFRGMRDKYEARTKVYTASKHPGFIEYDGANPKCKGKIYLPLNGAVNMSYVRACKKGSKVDPAGISYWAVPEKIFILDKQVITDDVCMSVITDEDYKARLESIHKSHKKPFTGYIQPLLENILSIN